jgi:hypothetical protein
MKAYKGFNKDMTCKERKICEGERMKPYYDHAGITIYLPYDFFLNL